MTTIHSTGYYLDEAKLVRVFGESSACGCTVHDKLTFRGSRRINLIITYQMMRPNIDPGDQVFLRNVLAIKEAMEVHHRVSGQVQIPHAARGGLCVFATRNRKVIPSPVGIFQQPL